MVFRFAECLLREFFETAQRGSPSNVSRAGIHREELTPRRLIARIVILVDEPRIAVHIAIRHWRLAMDRLRVRGCFRHPSNGPDIADIDKDVIEMGIE